VGVGQNSGVGVWVGVAVNVAVGDGVPVGAGVPVGTPVLVAGGVTLAVRGGSAVVELVEAGVRRVVGVGVRVMPQSSAVAVSWAPVSAVWALVSVVEAMAPAKSRSRSVQKLIFSAVASSLNLFTLVRSAPAEDRTVGIIEGAALLGQPL
jgi:hypothetical protein